MNRETKESSEPAVRMDSRHLGAELWVIPADWPHALNGPALVVTYGEVRQMAKWEPSQIRAYLLAKGTFGAVAPRALYDAPAVPPEPVQLSLDDALRQLGVEDDEI